MRFKIVNFVAALLAVAVPFLLISTSALALGIGVTPGKMDFGIEPGSSDSQTLYVNNPDSSETEFEVYAEGTNEEWFVITPSRFTLTGQEQKSVEITLAPPLSASPQEYNLSICVVSKSPGDDLLFGAGVKVQTHVEIVEMKAHTDIWISQHPMWITFTIIGLAAAVVAVVGVLVWRRRRARHA